MFYYISFLRPPPAQASTKSGGVAITPQVANDLRTEPYPGAVDIFYSWTPCGSPLAKPASVLTMQTTKPIKLTTWRQSNAYKELKVPLPPGVCSGSSWRLILSSTSSPGHHVIPLHGADVGSTPFPVVSLPIAFSASPLVKGDKHEEIERMFLVRTLGRDASLVIREQTSFDLDKKIWDSGIGLSAWLVDFCCGATTTKADDTGILDQLKAVLAGKGAIIELGAGTGVVLLAFAALLSDAGGSGSGAEGPPHCLLTPDLRTLPLPIIADASASGADGRTRSLLATDLQSALPLLNHNIATNAVAQVAGILARPNALALDWDIAEIPSEVQEAQRAGLDAIIMADVTYNTASFPSLIRTLASLANPDGHTAPLVILGYKERDPAERTLWKMAADIGLDFIQVGKRLGAGGAAIEIWLARMARIEARD